MSYKPDTSNSADIIDSRDIIERIRELQDEYDALNDTFEEAKCAAAEAAIELDRRVSENCPEAEIDEARRALREADDAEDFAREARTDWELDNNDELKALIALNEECEGYGDWKHGDQLVRDSYFEEYARQLADDIGAVADDGGWPARHIDWAAAADELKSDYSCVDYDGVDYWIHS